MKYWLLLGLLPSLASCHKAAPAPTNDFLGHWQADKIAYTMTTASGVVLNTFTASYAQTLDVTASTITYTHPTVVGGTVAVPVSFTYARSGEDLTITSGTWLGIETHVRDLTATSCTYEEKTVSAGGGFTITRVPYQR